MIIGISGKINSGKNTIGDIIQYLTDYKAFSYMHPITEKDFNDWKNNNHFLKSNWKQKAFADKLKDIICLLTGCTREQLEDREFKEKELGEEWWYYGFGDNNRIIMIPYLDNEYEKENKPLEYLNKLTPRKILQLLGTECGRNIIHPNIWINSLFADYTENDFSTGQTCPLGLTDSDKDIRFPNWIITDMRFPNEAQAIKDRGGILIRVNRPFVGDQDNVNNFINKDNVFHSSETALDNAEFDYVIDNNGSIEDLIEKVKEILIKENIL